jgi:hypothetical protein
MRCESYRALAPGFLLRFGQRRWRGCPVGDSVTDLEEELLLT